MTERTWTCRRVTEGVRCGAVNPRRKHICSSCGKRRPATRKPAHMAALGELSYDWWVERFGGRCGICGREPSANRRLDRDHWHTGPKAGEPRGLLCARCNRSLPTYITVQWLESAVRYLREAEGGQ